MDDSDLSIEVRIMARAHVAAFDIAHTGSLVAADTVEDVRSEMSYVGVLMAEILGIDRHGGVVADEPERQEGDPVPSLEEQLSEAHSRYENGIEALNTRLSVARVVIACADLVQAQGWKQIRQEGSLSSSSLEALSSAIDAFEEADRNLPMVLS